MHMIASHGCNSCDGAYDDLEEHTRNVHKTELCAECHSTFPSKPKLKRHLKRMHVVKCDICNAEFLNPEDLTEHKQEEHVEECDMC